MVKLQTLCLGLSDYEATPTYFGATVGRFANRIRRGKFTLDGEEHQAACNEGGNSLHGGTNGFDKRIWSASIDETGNSVTFETVSPDGDEGFPGNLNVSSTYILTDDNVVRMDIRATTDKPTLFTTVISTWLGMKA